jgi:hypothetical protein
VKLAVEDIEGDLRNGAQVNNTEVELPPWFRYSCRL